MYIILRSWTDAPKTKSIKMNNWVKYLVISVLLIIAPVKSLAYVVGESLTIDGWQITISSIDLTNGEVTALIGGCTSAISGDVTIPSTIYDGVDKTLTITALGGTGYNWSSGITSITIPNTVTKLSGGCFAGTKITTVNIPASVTSIAGDALSPCSELKSITVDSNNPNYQDHDGCLYSKNMQTLVTIPKQKPITDGVFTIPEGVKGMAERCTSNSDIKKLVVPSSVTSIWAGIGELTNFAAFEVSEDNSIYASQDGVLFDNAKSRLIKYPRAKADEVYTVPDGVKSIDAAAFYANLYIKTINLNQVEKLNAGSFTSCNKLTVVNIPKCLTSIDGGFVNCMGITAYNVDEGHPKYSSDNGVLYSRVKEDGTRDSLLLYPLALSGNYEIPEKYQVKVLAESAFMGSSITSISIPSSVITIDESCFETCRNLSNVTIAEGSQLKYINKRAFMYCYALTAFDFPEGLISTGSDSFNSSGLKSVRLPKSMTTLGAQTFTYSKIEEVIVADGSQITTFHNFTFAGCSLLKKVTFEGSSALTSIGGNCFDGDTNLTSFAVPKSVKTISARAFRNCKMLKEVTFDENAVIETIGATAFADCGIEKITLPPSIKIIEGDAFRHCTALKEVYLGKNAENISTTAFYECTNLEEINVDRANTIYSSSDGILLSANKEKLIIFPEGKANENFTLLPPSLTTIGQQAFYNNQKLTNVTIPNKVTKIESRAFGLCSNLKTVTFLCDEMIDPANIAQAQNAAAFDDGVTTTDDKRKNIDINVRKNLLKQYQDNEYYRTFHSITPSFIDNTEEYIAVSDNTVDLLDTQREDYTFLVPKTVTHEDESYKVSLIGDYCFQNAKDAIKEVVIYESVEYIGAKAFMTDINNNTSTVENIFFIEAQPTEDMLSTTRFLLDDTGKDYSEIAASTKVYVKKSAIDTYKTYFSRYINGAYKYNATTPFRPATPDMFDYKIPGISISSTYGTISREFDIDLGDVNENGEMKWWDDAKACPKVIAFTGAEDKTADNLTDTKWITMHSIFEGEDKKVDGLYVPAFTGVVLKAIDGNTPEDFYYRIGESDKYSYDGENVMKDVTVNKKTVSPTEDNGINFYISGGKLWKVASSKELPVHKSYMQLKEVSAGAKVMMRFSNGETTGIEVIMQQGSENGEVYDLQGRRVMDPQKGIYIKNGKKIVVR